MNKKKSTRALFSLKVISFTAILLISFFVFTSFQYSNAGYPDLEASQFTVVIDAAHGGQDTGASQNGLQEKNLVLSIARMVEQQIDSKVKVILTRTSDVTMTLEERNKLAKTRNADLFLSLHINSATNKQLNGIEIYHFDPNSTSYAQLIANNLTRYDSKPRIDVGNFAVLRNLDCPAMILELGFISNEGDFQFLSSETKLSGLAEAVAEGVMEISKLE